MDYKIVSPSEYFGTSSAPMIGNNIFMSHNAVGNQLNSVILPSQNEGGLNVLANGAVAASSAGPSQGIGYQYPLNPNDNYGYIVLLGCNVVLANFIILEIEYQNNLLPPKSGIF